MRPALRARLSMLAIAAALPIGGCSDLGGGGSGAAATVAKASGRPAGELTISQWPFYVDRDTIPQFSDKTGVEVNYIEDVNDNTEIFSKLQPDLQNGSSAGRSIVVVSDWMAKKMYDLGYLHKVDQSALKTVDANLLATLRHPSFDPERQYSVPWQSGMTGLIVNRDEADVTSIADIFDPAYEGKVTVLSELRDTVPLVIKSMGVEIDDATGADWLAAIEKLRAAVESGQIRAFTGNDYTDDLARGDATVAIGWSGDAVQLQADNPSIEFRMPEEGCILWSDNMVIPIGAPNPTAAYAFMNYVYEPEHQAQIAAYNNYVTPVEGVAQVFARGADATLADDPLIFPSKRFTANCDAQPNPPADAATEIEKAFGQLITGGG